MIKKDKSEYGYDPRHRPPEGVEPPMCFCGDKYKFMRSMDDLIYEMRYWKCGNYSYTPEKPKPRPKRGPHANKPVTPPPSSPPLCDFVEWIDKEVHSDDWAELIRYKEFNRELFEMRYQRVYEREEEEKRREEVDRKAKEEREAERERKRERARRAKEAEPDAKRKGKYPRCTQ